MSDLFDLPLYRATDLYTPIGDAALREICTPITDADDSDIVGLTMEAHVNRGQVYIRPIKTALKRPSKSNWHLSPSHLLQLDEEYLARIAKPYALLHGAGLDTGALCHAILSLCNGEDDTFVDAEVIAMPGYAIVTRNDYESSVVNESIVLDGFVSQETIRNSMVVIQAFEPETAHEVIEARQTLLAIREIVNWMFPMPSPDDPHKTAPLALPNIPTIPRLRH
jgi:hypothetical protein